MRIPIILALIVVIALPRDIQGLVTDVSAQVRTAGVAVMKLLDRHEEQVQVATLTTGQAGPQKGPPQNPR
jgi:predicted RNA polymerase sigma factor